LAAGNTWNFFTSWIPGEYMPKQYRLDDARIASLSPRPATAMSGLPPVSALREGDEISQGKAVSFDIGVDKKSGKNKAVSVDLV
jgi:hypothetical protein